MGHGYAKGTFDGWLTDFSITIGWPLWVSIGILYYDFQSIIVVLLYVVSILIYAFYLTKRNVNNRWEAINLFGILYAFIYGFGCTILRSGAVWGFILYCISILFVSWLLYWLWFKNDSKEDNRNIQPKTTIIQDNVPNRPSLAQTIFIDEDEVIKSSWTMHEFRAIHGPMSRVKGSKDGNDYEFLLFGDQNEGAVVLFGNSLGILTKEQIKERLNDLLIYSEIDNEGTPFYVLREKKKPLLYQNG